MARYILDIANDSNTQETMTKLCNFLSNEIATIKCIDKTNANQFHNEEHKNSLLLTIKKETT